MRLTVFTPAYNRQKLLVRAYESLCRQTNKDFEWLIVDDGSSDDTKSEVEGWISEGKISIRYYYVENGGKMRAHNLGAKLSAAPLFICLDSDDYLTDTAVEELLDCYDRAVREADRPEKTEVLTKDGRSFMDKPTVGGIVAHKGKSESELLGASDFPEGDYSTLYGLYMSGFKGETTLMYRTDILRKFPFPEIEGEKYVPEDYIYDKIDCVCVLAVLNKIITVCEIVSEGYTDSVSRLKRDNPTAWYLYYEQRARITPRGVLRLKYLGRFVIYAKRAGKSAAGDKDIPLADRILGYAMAGFLIIIRKERLT